MIRAVTITKIAIAVWLARSRKQKGNKYFKILWSNIEIFINLRHKTEFMNQFSWLGDSLWMYQCCKHPSSTLVFYRLSYLLFILHLFLTLRRESILNTNYSLSLYTSQVGNMYGRKSEETDNKASTKINHTTHNKEQLTLGRIFLANYW